MRRIELTRLAQFSKSFKFHFPQHLSIHTNVSISYRQKNAHSSTHDFYTLMNKLVSVAVL